MTKPRTSYTPDQVAEAFSSIRSNLDLIEIAYSEAISTPVPEPDAFIVYDASSSGEINAKHGLPRLKTPSESNFFPGSARGAPDLEWIAENACPKMAKYNPLVIDIECYGTKENPDDPAKTTAQETEWLRSIVETFQRENPGQLVGVYSYPPERYGGCSSYPPGSPTYNERWEDWAERNAIMQPLADQVHAEYPSLYGLYSKMEQWVQFATGNIEQTYMLAPNKKVIAYLWPEWHNNAEAEGFIGYDDWMVMLETCFEHCDGIAIWEGSWYDLDESQPWWQATVDFCNAHGIPMPGGTGKLDRDKRDTRTRETR